jgi:hypothetical protein
MPRIAEPMPRTQILLALSIVPLLLTGCIFGHGDPVPSDLRPKGVLVIVPGLATARALASMTR